MTKILNKNLSGFILITFILVFASCAKQNPKQEDNRVQVALLSPELRAKLIDIPFILGTKKIWHLNSQEDQKIVLRYNTKLNIQDIFGFYQAQMIHLGWQDTGIFYSLESCLTFIKPVKQAIITILDNPENNKERVITIFIGARKLYSR